MNREIPKKIGHGNLGITDLNVAFEKFTSSSDRLANLYAEMKEKVAAIDRELEGKNRALNDNVKKLNRTTQYLDSVLQSMHSGVVAVDLNGIVTMINKSAREILGLRNVRVVGESCESVIVPVGAIKGSLLMDAIGKRVVSINKKRELLRSDKQGVWVESSVTLLRDGDGSVVGAVEIFKDLSEVRELEDRLEEADNLASIGEMTASVAHEIRNPLNGIKGFAALLENGFNKADPRKRFVNNIVKGVENLDSMVTDLLVLAKPIKPELRDNRIGDILSEVISFAREDLRVSGSHIDIDFDYGRGESVVRCDRNLLYQVFFNLLKNSFQAINGEGAVSVSVRSAHRMAAGQVDGANRGVEIAISDNGVGIGREEQSKIFEPFFTTKSGGTGLGLSLVQKIIKMHKGEIELESAPGKGTTFRLLFPENQGDGIRM